MLAPASFAMASKKTKKECSAKLNERMHALIAYCEEDWNQHLMSDFKLPWMRSRSFKLYSDALGTTNLRIL